MNALDTTHTVYVKSENKGLRVLVGAVILFIWARYWWYGSLYEALLPHYEQTEQLKSATGTVLQLAVDLLWGIGSVVIGILSMGKWVLTDVFTGIAEFWRRRSIDRQAEKEATSAAITSATATATSQASQRAIDQAKLVAVLESHESRLTSLEKGPPRPPYRRVTRQEKPKGK